MKLEEAIKEFISLQEDLETLPVEITAHQTLIDAMLQENGNELDVRQAQEIFDVKEDMAKLKDEEQAVCTRLVQIKKIITDYLIIVEHKKIRYNNALQKGLSNSYVFEMNNGRLAVNGNVLPD